MENKAFLIPDEKGIPKTSGYGFYNKDNDSSQIEVSKNRPDIPTIAPGSGNTSGNISKNVGMRKVIHTTGGY